MKKLLLLFVAAVTTLSLISWGSTGHKAVAQIADNHLTAQARLGIQNLLGKHETLADVSTWADEIRSNQQYKYTAPWHYVNLVGGLSFEEFAAAVKTMPEDNVYKLLLRCQVTLESNKASKNQKTEAIKFIIHFVGDMHQPMHVSHAEDKGGNNVSVTFIGSSYNLHGLWDSGLIEHENLNYKQMATDYDTATPVETAKWQSDSPMVWLWESYKISTILYEEAASDPAFDETYYQTHLPVLKKRIEKAGIRLAGVLNKLF